MTARVYFGTSYDGKILREHRCYPENDPNDMGPKINGKITIDLKNTPLSHVRLFLDVIKALENIVDGRELYIDDVGIKITLDESRI